MTVAGSSWDAPEPILTNIVSHRSGATLKKKKLDLYYELSEPPRSEDGSREQRFQASRALHKTNSFTTAGMSSAILG